MIDLKILAKNRGFFEKTALTREGTRKNTPSVARKGTRKLKKSKFLTLAQQVKCPPELNRLF
jgi:hypothetical protein